MSKLYTLLHIYTQFKIILILTKNLLIKLHILEQKTIITGIMYS